ncbi:hypothetical protein [Mucilaginibacter sp. BT774]|uniref:hypothetical protein n=1 Tax=Mucilaginibacter sp. BT774 TaxID=3062276 RepID=UPI0026744E30|nr:hypothetical protein [Mucilaginibacter sp. BT774]MDO3627601.1 hypothetical protein [Mucilaginibacter sp. BT774]
MSRLPVLMRALRAFTVVIIENALQYETDPGIILGKFSLKRCNRAKICSTLCDLGHKDCADLLQKFYVAFEQSARKPEIEAKGAENFFKHYITKDCGITDLNEDEVMSCLGKLIAADESDEVKSALMKYGLFSIEEADYNEIISEIHQVEESEILFYKGDPPAHAIETFFLELDEASQRTGSEFCLAIVDKKLGTGGADEEGRNFIINQVVPENEKRDKKIICCLYTSSPVELIPTEFTDYFIQEVGKTSAEKLDVISRTLARSAYAQVFNILMLQCQRSAANAREMVLKNQKNIKYVLQHSIREGIPGFEAIKYWFNLAQQYQLEQVELVSLPLIAGIINFFDNQHLEDHPHIGKIGPELKELNSFELFDKNVNQKFQPVTPGDIFQIGTEHYILMGQLCDISLRSTNTRKAKLGELLKLSFIEIPGDDEKYSITVDDGRKSITIQNFPMEDGTYTNIVIDVSTDTTEFAELAALDTVMFNEKGEARLSIDKSKQIDALKIMPEHLSQYYLILQDKYILLKSVKDAAQTDLTALINSDVRFSTLNFAAAGDTVNLGFKRIARLKGRYFDSVYNNFLNNKGRIDLNLIDNSPEYASTVKLTCSFLPDHNPLQVIENANLWFSKGNYYFKTDELISLLPEGFRPLLNLYGTETISTGSHMYDLTKNEDGSYNLDLKYYIHKNLYQGKSVYSYKTLFNENKPVNDPLFRVDGEDIDQNFLNEAGHPANPLSLEQLKKGVTVNEKKVHLQLVNGILIRKDLEEQD